MEREPPDELEPAGFDLHWPTDALAEPFESRHQAPLDRPFALSTTPPATATAIPNGDLSTTLASVASRVEVLSDTTVTFGDAIEDRLRENAERVAKSLVHQAAKLSRLARSRDHAVAGVATELAQVSGRLEAVAASVERLIEQVAVLRAEVAHAVDSTGADVRALRRRTPVRARRVPDGDELEAVVATVAEQLRADDGVGPNRRRRKG
jgi:ABC-type transporter Mla subunit MlaD